MGVTVPLFWIDAVDTPTVPVAMGLRAGAGPRRQCPARAQGDIYPVVLLCFSRLCPQHTRRGCTRSGCSAWQHARMLPSRRWSSFQALAVQRQCPLQCPLIGIPPVYVAAERFPSPAPPFSAAVLPFSLSLCLIFVCCSHCFLEPPPPA